MKGSLYFGANDGRIYKMPLNHRGNTHGQPEVFMQFAERITNKVAFNNRKNLLFISTFDNQLFAVKLK